MPDKEVAAPGRMPKPNGAIGTRGGNQVALRAINRGIDLARVTVIRWLDLQARAGSRWPRFRQPRQ